VGFGKFDLGKEDFDKIALEKVEPGKPDLEKVFTLFRQWVA